MEEKSPRMPPPPSEILHQILETDRFCLCHLYEIIYVLYSTVLHSSTPGCPYKLKATKMMYLQHTIPTTLNNLSEDKKILN